MSGEYGTRTTTLYVEGMHCERCVETLRTSLSEIKGVEYCDVEIGKAQVTYMPQLAAPADLRRGVEAAGFAARAEPPKQSGWQRFIDRMIRSNERVFGGKRPDCCTIIRDQEERARQEKLN